MKWVSLRDRRTGSRAGRARLRPARRVVRPVPPAPGSQAPEQANHGGVVGVVVFVAAVWIVTSVARWIAPRPRWFPEGTSPDQQRPGRRLPPMPDGTAAVSGAVEAKDLLLSSDAVPADAWEDPEIKPFVPSRYRVCHWSEGGSTGYEDPSRVVGFFPAPARALIRELSRGQVSATPKCYEVTTDDARALFVISAISGCVRLTCSRRRLRLGGSPDLYGDQDDAPAWGGGRLHQLRMSGSSFA